MMAWRPKVSGGVFRSFTLSIISKMYSEKWPLLVLHNYILYYYHHCLKVIIYHTYQNTICSVISQFSV